MDENSSTLSFRDILDASAANLSSGSVLTVTDVSGIVVIAT